MPCQRPDISCGRYWSREMPGAGAGMGTGLGDGLLLDDPPPHPESRSATRRIKSNYSLLILSAASCLSESRACLSKPLRWK